MFKAIQDRRTIDKTIRALARSLSFNAETIVDKNIGYDAERILWRPDLGIWGCFQRPTADHKHWWNAFGREPARFRSNITVEINPLIPGGRTHGLVATDDETGIWILHAGRLRKGQKIITQDIFRSVSDLEEVEVEFSNGDRDSYFKVACVSAPAADTDAQLSKFVEAC